MAPTRKKLGEILIEMGAIDRLQLDSALRFHQQWGHRIGRALVESNFCAPGDITRALSLQTGHPVIDLEGLTLDRTTAQMLGVKHAERFRVVPLKTEGARGEVLVVASEGPASIETVDAVRNAAGKRKVIVHLADDDLIEQAIGFLYHGRERHRRAKASGPGTAVGVQTDVVFELEPEAAAPARPVLLYGWHAAAARALAALLEQGGIASRVASDEDLDALDPEDVVVASTLALHAALPYGARINGRLVIAGLPQDLDAKDAERAGAQVYLQPPFNSERVCGAIRRCREL